MTFDTTGEQDLRAEKFDRIVKGFALRKYVMKQFCMIQSSSAWSETYYKETAADPEGGAGSAVKEIPRLGPFPYGEVSWTKVTGINIKHGMDSVLAWEDVKMNNVPMIARTLLRNARAVTKSVDAVISAAVLDEAGNSVSANAAWDAATIADRDPIQDILDAKAEIEVDDYDPDAPGHLLVHPKDKAHLLGNPNIRNVGQFYTDAVTRNGFIGMLLGLRVLSSNGVTENGAQVVIGKPCNWKDVSSLKTHTIVDPGVDYKIRSWEVGQIQVVEPNMICNITGV